MSKTPQDILDPEIRCTKCNKLLARNHSNKDVFEVKCSRCGTLNAIFEKMADQIIITDPSGIILYTNDSLENITGYTSSEAIGKTPALWGGLMSKKFYEDMWDVISRQKKSIKVNLRNKRKDGVIYNASLRISPILNTAGDIQFYIGIETVIEATTSWIKTANGSNPAKACQIKKVLAKLLSVVMPCLQVVYS